MTNLTFENNPSIAGFIVALFVIAILGIGVMSKNPVFTGILIAAIIGLAVILTAINL